jgi:hypothetical protein
MPNRTFNNVVTLYQQSRYHTKALPRSVHKVDGITDGFTGPIGMTAFGGIYNITFTFGAGAKLDNHYLVSMVQQLKFSADNP